mmetsp:Transcript_33079/g.107005  ORF Transcript_33079/g.107005 Transcript_33079/m.107005 type:complete len:315 (-) Transcript_33079:276-1220(-)
MAAAPSSPISFRGIRNATRHGQAPNTAHRARAPLSPIRFPPSCSVVNRDGAGGAASGMGADGTRRVARGRLPDAGLDFGRGRRRSGTVSSPSSSDRAGDGGSGGKGIGTPAAAARASPRAEAPMSPSSFDDRSNNSSVPHHAAPWTSAAVPADPMPLLGSESSTSAAERGRAAPISAAASGPRALEPSRNTASTGDRSSRWQSEAMAGRGCRSGSTRGGASSSLPSSSDASEPVVSGTTISGAPVASAAAAARESISACRSPRAKRLRSAVAPSDDRSSAVSVVLWAASASKIASAPAGPTELAPALSQTVESD